MPSQYILGVNWHLFLEIAEIPRYDLQNATLRDRCMYVGEGKKNAARRYT